MTPVKCDLESVCSPLVFAKQGYIRFNAQEFLPPKSVASLRALADRAATSLPPDPTCQGGFRNREHRRAYYYPASDNLVVCKVDWDRERAMYVSEYSQVLKLNPLDGGQVRTFAAIGADILQHEGVRDLIRHDFALTRFLPKELKGVFEVNLHLVNVFAKPGQPAHSSPPTVHRDGEPYTFAHLLDFKAKGGKNWITDPEWAGKHIEDVPMNAVRAGFLMTRFLDSYGVKDDMVAHSVDSIYAFEDGRPGTRTVLLIDFTPLVPNLIIDLPD